MVGDDSNRCACDVGSEILEGQYDAYGCEEHVYIQAEWQDVVQEGDYRYGGEAVLHFLKGLLVLWHPLEYFPFPC